jgi:hypothetical protein
MTTPHAGIVAAGPGSRPASLVTRPHRLRLRQLSWTAVPFLTFGMFGAAPFLTLAVRRRRPGDWLVFGSYLAATVVYITIVAAGRGTGAAAFGLLLWGVSTAHAFTAYRPSAAEAGQGALGTSRANRRAIAVAQARLQLATHLRLTAAEAAAVSAAREQLGRFTSAEELSAYAELPPARLDALRDLMLFS